MNLNLSMSFCGTGRYQLAWVQHAPPTTKQPLSAAPKKVTDLIQFCKSVTLFGAVEATPQPPQPSVCRFCGTDASTNLLDLVYLGILGIFKYTTKITSEIFEIPHPPAKQNKVANSIELALPSMYVLHSSTSKVQGRRCKQTKRSEEELVVQD